MDVDLRPVKKLRESAAARAALGPIIEAVCASPADLSRLRVVCDWIQYRGNFREPVVSRPIAGTDVEIAVDLRRAGDVDLEAGVKHALEDPAGLPLEPWVPGRDSCIWRFNALYWQALSGWEQATGREYEQSLPGGESDARNAEAARSSSWSCSGSGTTWPPAGPCPTSCTSWSSAWGTATRPAPGWTSSSSWTAGTDATTTAGCAT
jgi:hypothetical protein